VDSNLYQANLTLNDNKLELEPFITSLKVVMSINSEQRPLRSALNYWLWPNPRVAAEFV